MFVLKIGSYKDVEPESFFDGKVLKRVLIGPRDNSPNFAMRLFTLRPGASTPYHSHDWEHEVFIIDGKVNIKSKDGEVTAEKGTFVFVQPNEEHQFVNVGDKFAHFICIVPNRGEQ
ncbi:MAG TPA: cupin domain-containing protein [Pseudothermotoga sp.]|nr:cupin domain-containing protein [Pseudothermotoga sp.]HOK83480.1 cupin domain-containing protein [Pseudothermotoga sp.]HPP69553.1 cupin domain-containing protein [Pseudothermotoga sp.]